MAQCISCITKNDTVSIPSMTERPRPKKFGERLRRFCKLAFSRKPKKHPTSSEDAAEQDAAASAPKKVGKMKRFFKRAFQKSKDNTTTQPNPAGGESSAQPVPDGQAEDVATCALPRAVQELDDNVISTDLSLDKPHISEKNITEDEQDDISVYSWYSCVSSAEQDSDTDSVCSWYSCRSSQKDSDTDSVCSWYSCRSSLNDPQDSAKDIPSPKQKDAAAAAAAWKTEEEEIKISLEPNKGNFYKQYKTGDRLGVGAYGYVIDATRLSDSRKVAVKVVHKKSMQNVKFGLFDKPVPQEVGMMHIMSKGPDVPQIIKMLDWYETSCYYLLVLEQPMPGVDMIQYLRRQNYKLKESAVRVVMRQVVTAARICFERGVYHHDIKLQNLLINPNTLQVKLIDFGVSKPLRKSGYKSYRGTMAYASPECYTKFRHHAEPTTVYSLGVVHFKMVCGKIPSWEVQKAIFKTWEFSRESRDLIRSCLMTDPGKRIALKKILLHDWFQVVHLD